MRSPVPHTAAAEAEARIRVVQRPSVVVTTSTYPRWPGDSHPPFVHELCAHLAADLDITVLAPTSHGAQRDEVVDGVRVKRFAYWRDRPGLLRDGAALPTLRRHPLTALQVPAYLAALDRALTRELAEQARAGRTVAAVHTHWVLPQGTLAAMRRKRIRPARLVMTAHGSDVFGVPASAPTLRWTLRRADAFTGVSRAVVDRARELGLPATTPATVAPMGIDEALFRPDEPDRRAMRAEHGIDGPLLLFVGRLTATKGIDVLLDALPHVVTSHPTARLVVIGHGEQEATLRQGAEARGLGRSVTFLGFQPKPVLARWYRAADVLVGPSRSEGFGLVFAEALASGCPVVASDLEAIRDILDDTSVGEVTTVGDPVELAQALSEAVAKSEERRQAAVADAERQGRRFGWGAASERYRELLVPTLPDTSRSRR